MRAIRVLGWSYSESTEGALRNGTVENGTVIGLLGVYHMHNVTFK